MLIFVVFFYDIWFETRCKSKVRTAKSDNKEGVKAVSTRQQEVHGWPHSISDIELETVVQIQFFTNCNHTLIAQRGVGVWMKG